MTSDQQELLYHMPTIFSLLMRPKRYKIFFGGRGSGKSWALADFIVGLMDVTLPRKEQPLRILCGREFQNSIAESVHFELVASIRRTKRSDVFKITDKSILCLRTGAHTLYRGLHNNVDQIKSLGGIDLLWGEEAHAMTEDTLTYVDPTIRRDAPFGPFGTGSEIWYTFNQHDDDDPIYKRFNCAKALMSTITLDNGRKHQGFEDEDMLVVPVTYKDNPFFPKVLERQRTLLEKQANLRHIYDWVWGTACRSKGGAFFLEDNLKVGGMPVAVPSRCDGIFAVIDSATKTGNEHDGTACIYFAIDKHNPHGAPLIILDYDLVQIEGAMLEVWLPTVYRNMETLAKMTGARHGVLGAWVEDRASGMILLQQAKRRGMSAMPIDSKLTSVGKDERAISVSGYVHQGLVKISSRAFDRVVDYKGDTRNHLLSQVTKFTLGDKDAATRADDLLDCFCYGIAIALGNQAGF